MSLGRKGRVLFEEAKYLIHDGTQGVESTSITRFASWGAPRRDISLVVVIQNHSNAWWWWVRLSWRLWWRSVVRGYHFGRFFKKLCFLVHLVYCFVTFSFCDPWWRREQQNRVVPMTLCSLLSWSGKWRFILCKLRWVTWSLLIRKKTPPRLHFHYVTGAKRLKNLPTSLSKLQLALFSGTSIVMREITFPVLSWPKHHIRRDSSIITFSRTAFVGVVLSKFL